MRPTQLHRPSRRGPRTWGAISAVLCVLLLAPAAGAAPADSWAVVPALSAEDSAALTGVSCPVTGFCMAVGAFSFADDLAYGIPGVSGATAELWNGSTWTPIPVPAPAGAESTAFTAVSCTSASACTAVGSVDTPALANGGLLAESWNGVSWTIDPVTQPSALSFVDGAGFTGVSCTSASACVAVATGEADGGPPDFTTIEIWNGTQWTLQANPSGDPSAGGSSSSVSQTLTSVSCTSASACLAVGSSHGEPMDELWNGTAWSTGPPPPASAPPTDPEPGTAYLDQLNSVSCSGDGCVAVGAATEGPALGGTPQSSTATAATWNGSTWSQTPLPAGAGGLNGVDCTSADSCVADGQSDGSQAIALGFEAGAWSREPLTTAPYKQTGLAGVSCPSGGTCTFVGAVQGAAAAMLAVGPTETAGVTVQPTPALAEVGDESFNAVACPAAGRCRAVGTAFPGDGLNRPVAATLAAGAWSLTPVKVRSGDGALLSVGCVRPSECEATGSGSQAADELGDISPTGSPIFAPTLAAGLTGARWNGQTTPQRYPASDAAYGQPDGNGVTTAADNALAGVSCPAAGHCIAVGSAEIRELDISSCGCVLGSPVEVHRLTQIIAVLAHGAWSQAAVALPRAIRDPQLAAVACTTATRCLAVGHASTRPLVEALAAGHWSVLWTPPAAAGALRGVACPARAVCFAVGSSPKSKATPAGTLILRLTGTRWSIAQSAEREPTGAAGGQLNAISCTSTTACTAVGSIAGAPLIEAWDGTRWSVEPVAAAVGLGPDTLNGVACTSPTRCVAVGATGFGPLVEQSSPALSAGAVNATRSHGTIRSSSTVSRAGSRRTHGTHRRSPCPGTGARGCRCR